LYLLFLKLLEMNIEIFLFLFIPFSTKKVLFINI